MSSRSSSSGRRSSSDGRDRPRSSSRSSRRPSSGSTSRTQSTGGGSGGDGSVHDRITQKSNSIAENYIVNNGGWLGQFVMSINNMTGIWALSILITVGVFAWVILRNLSMEMCAVMAKNFDVVIPAQYQTHAGYDKIHEKHLKRYWPFAFAAFCGEVVGYFTLHPDLFTLVVCLKTLMMTFLWFTSGKGLPVPAPGSTSRPTPPSRQPQPSPEPSRPSEPSSEPSKPQSQASGPGKLGVHPDIPDTDKRLEKAGYDNPKARAGMIEKLKDMSPEKAKEKLKSWEQVASIPDENKRKERMLNSMKDGRNVYEKRKGKYGGSQPGQGGDGGGGDSGATENKLGFDPRIPDADERLKAVGFEDAKARAGMIEKLKEQPTLDAAKRRLQGWESVKSLPEEQRKAAIQASTRGGKEKYNQVKDKYEQGDDGGDGTGTEISGPEVPPDLEKKRYEYFGVLRFDIEIRGILKTTLNTTDDDVIGGLVELLKVEQLKTDKSIEEGRKRGTNSYKNFAGIQRKQWGESFQSGDEEKRKATQNAFIKVGKDVAKKMKPLYPALQKYQWNDNIPPTIGFEHIARQQQLKEKLVRHPELGRARLGHVEKILYNLCRQTTLRNGRKTSFLPEAVDQLAYFTNYQYDLDPIKIAKMNKKAEMERAQCKRLESYLKSNTNGVSFPGDLVDVLVQDYCLQTEEKQQQLVQEWSAVKKSETKLSELWDQTDIPEPLYREVGTHNDLHYPPR